MSSIFKKHFSIISYIENFNTRIKALRTEHKLSQNALAKKINSSQKIIDYWEKGDSEPKANFIVALADCFGVSCDYLLGREDDFGNVKLLILAYNRSNEKNKETLLNFARFLVDNNSSDKQRP